MSVRTSCTCAIVASKIVTANCYETTLTYFIRRICFFDFSVTVGEIQKSACNLTLPNVLIISNQFCSLCELDEIISFL